jgi:hypothetical protein
MPDRDPDLIDIKEAERWLGLTTNSQCRRFREAIKRKEIPAMVLSRNKIILHKPTLMAKFGMNWNGSKTRQILVAVGATLLGTLA